jgi:hypothetical protein
MPDSTFRFTLRIMIALLVGALINGSVWAHIGYGALAFFLTTWFEQIAFECVSGIIASLKGNHK